MLCYDIVRCCAAPVLWPTLHDRALTAARHREMMVAIRNHRSVTENERVREPATGPKAIDPVSGRSPGSAMLESMVKKSRTAFATNRFIRSEP
jgi:hypothetical protein